MEDKNNKSKSYMLCAKKSIALNEEGKLLVDGNLHEDDLDGENAKTKAQQLTTEYYRVFLQNQFENLVILSGAGTSMDHPDGSYPKLGGKSVPLLWPFVLSALKDNSEFLKNVKYTLPEGTVGNVEELLSQARLANQFSQSDSIENGINSIEQEIVKQCKLTLPNSSPHEMLLQRVTARKLKLPRVKIFTLNYDTLFEQAAIKGAYTVIDGFSFSFPRTFNGQYFDHDVVIRENSRIEKEENYVPRVFHLYKLHGSLDWKMSADGKVIKSEDTTSPILIYPRNDKYEVSYQQPFFEMIARFQSYLRMKNTLLICIGFSFADMHIRSIILEAARSNPGFQLMVVLPNIDSSSPDESEPLKTLINEAKTNPNITLISDYFHTFAKNIPYPPNYSQDIERVVRPESRVIE